MSEIVLSAEQARQMATAEGPVVVRTESGDLLGFLEPFTPEDQAELDEVKARLGRPHQRYTIAQVLERLQSGADR
jgi:hypothetical protein